MDLRQAETGTLPLEQSGRRGSFLSFMCSCFVHPERLARGERRHRSGMPRRLRRLIVTQGSQGPRTCYKGRALAVTARARLKLQP